jgi:broad specificity phosphatase PhoE
VRQLGAELANLAIDLGVCTRFLRTRQTLEVALGGRDIPVVTDPGFDEIRAGDLEGQPIQAYWSWNEHHTGSERFPHGESVNEALLRYANALRRLVLRPESGTLLVVHEFALRRIAAAATTSSSLSSSPPFANALPYLFDEGAIQRAAFGLEASVRSGPTEHGSAHVSTRVPGRRRIQRSCEGACDARVRRCVARAEKPATDKRRWSSQSWLSLSGSQRRHQL